MRVRTACSISPRVGRVIRPVGSAPDRWLEIRLLIFTSAFILFLQGRVCKAADQWMAMERKGSRSSLRPERHQGAGDFFAAIGGIARRSHARSSSGAQRKRINRPDWAREKLPLENAH